MEIAKTILLVRHGATRYNEDDLLQGRVDLPLSPRGEDQVNHLAGHLSGRPIELLFHSPLLRAEQTTEIINRSHGCETVVLPSLVEIDMGEWEGREYAEVVSSDPVFYRQWLQDPALPVPGGESYQQVVDRVKPAVQTILETEEQLVVVVGHAAVNRAVLSRLLKMETASARFFRMKNAAFSELLVYQPGRDPVVIVESWNNTFHLDGLR